MRNTFDKHFFLYSLIFISALKSNVFAYNSDKATAFIDSFITFLIYSIGPAMFLVSFVMWISAFVKSEQGWLKKGMQVFISGVFITIATWLSDIVFSWS